MTKLLKFYRYSFQPPVTFEYIKIASVRHHTKSNNNNKLSIVVFFFSFYGQNFTNKSTSFLIFLFYSLFFLFCRLYLILFFSDRIVCVLFLVVSVYFHLVASFIVYTNVLVKVKQRYFILYFFFLSAISSCLPCHFSYSSRRSLSSSFCNFNSVGFFFLFLH